MIVEPRDLTQQKLMPVWVNTHLKFNLLLFKKSQISYMLFEL